MIGKPIMMMYITTMGTSKDQIRHWLKEAISLGATHLIVVCDGFTYECYPIKVRLPMLARDVAKQFDGSDMQRIMEVYDLSLSIEDQLAEHRAMHYGDEDQLRGDPPSPMPNVVAVVPYVQDTDRFKAMDNKIYFGDGLYGSYDGVQIMLFAYDGIDITNEVYLEPAALKVFFEYTKTLGFLP